MLQFALFDFQGENNISEAKTEPRAVDGGGDADNIPKDGDTKPAVNDAKTDATPAKEEPSKEIDAKEEKEEEDEKDDEKDEQESGEEEEKEPLGQLSSWFDIASLNELMQGYVHSMILPFCLFSFLKRTPNTFYMQRNLVLTHVTTL